jgi:hypothetical protein
MKQAVRSIIVVVCVLVASIVTGLYIAHAPTSVSNDVEVQTYGFSAASNTMCRYLATSTPVAPFSVPKGSEFRLSWNLTCVGGSYPPGTHLNAVSSLTSGFTVVGSDLPLVLAQGTYADFTVLLRAPSAPYSGALSLWVDATAAP